MPVMLPADIGVDRFTSQSERDVFGYIKDSEVDGYAVHSLGFDLHGYKEIDYVLITSRGVLCLEVKGGIVRRTNNRWFYVDHKGNSHDGGSGPYKQAFDNMHALRQRFTSHFISGDLRHLQFSYGVVMPDMPYSFSPLDCPREVTFDKTKGLDQFPDFVESCFDYSEKQCIAMNGVPGTRIRNRKDLDTVKDFLVGDFGYVPGLAEQLDGLERRLEAATSQQYGILQAMRRNRALLISGGAGTGKSMLATEHARRLAADGNKVLYVTFNKLIKNYLARTAPCPGVTYDNFDNILTRAVYGDKPPEIPPEQLKTHFENLREDFVNIDGLPPEQRFDALIVDEAQDILNETSLLCLDLMVKGGLREGRVAVFYDCMQNIFNMEAEDSLALERAVASLENDYRFSSYELSLNCRSTRRIVDFTAVIGGAPLNSMSEVDGLPVSVEYYKTPEEQRALLARIVKALRKDGVNPEDIVVVSHVGEGNPKGCFYDLSALNGICAMSFISADRSFEKVPGLLQLTTVQRFKGMEAKVVIVADVYRLKDDAGRTQKWHYTAFSRAKAHLVVLAGEEIKKDLSRLLKKLT